MSTINISIELVGKKNDDDEFEWEASAFPENGDLFGTGWGDTAADALLNLTETTIFPELGE